MTRRFDLLVVGDPVADVVVAADRLPAWADKTLGRPLGMHAGGTEANAGCAASRLGWRCAVYGAVGDDQHGRFLVEEFRRFGVALDHLEQRPGTCSAMCVIFVSPVGERAVVYVPASSPRPAGEALEAALRDARYAHTMPYDGEALAALGAAARRVGTELAVDVEAELLRSDPGVLPRVLEHADLVFFNEPGFVAATGRAADAAALRDLLARSRAHTVVVSLGAQGAIAADRHGGAEHPAFNGPVVDTTGAGDTFNAAFLFARADGSSLHRSLAFGCAAASCCIREVGARAGMPTRGEVLRLLEQR